MATITNKYQEPRKPQAALTLEEVRFADRQKEYAALIEKEALEAKLLKKKAFSILTGAAIVSAGLIYLILEGMK
jgi:hypothetical protein